MKGFIIYEDFITDFKSVVNCGRLSPACYTCRGSVNDLPEAGVSGGLLETTTAICSGDDKYDFETGALIALMRMVGNPYKVLAALDLTFPEFNSGKEYIEMNKALGEAADTLTELNDKYDKAMDGLKKAKELDELREKQIKELNENINELFESDKYWKSEAGRLSFEKHRLEEENEKLQHDYGLCKNSENALKCSIDYLNKYVAKLNVAIHGYKEENKMLCDKIKFLDKENRNLVFGGRQNGKQYTFLVELFKKIDQKKVDAAYKEVYGDRAIWCTSQPSIRDQLDSLIEGSKYAIPYTTEWIKPPTKREEMWAEIFALHKESDVIIKVKKEDVNTFLHEIENKIPEITWLSGVKIFEAKGTIKDIYAGLKLHNTNYFRLRKENKLSYTSDPDIYQYRELKHIDYLPPMRWDLFKKGRIIVKVNDNNYEDFYNKCEEEIGRKPIYKYTGTFTVYYKYKKELEQYIFHTRPYEDTIPFAKKIVDWEDVRGNTNTMEDPYDTWKW